MKHVDICTEPQRQPVSLSSQNMNLNPTFKQTNIKATVIFKI